MRSYKVNGQTLRKEREGAGLSVKGLAEKALTTANYVYKIENGARQPSAPLAGRLADACGVPLKTLLQPQPAPDPALQESA